MISTQKPTATATASTALVPRGTGMIPLCSDTTHCWCVSDHWFYRLDYATGALTKSFRIPAQAGGILAHLKDWVARSRIRNRLRPGTPINNMAMLRNGDLVILFDRVYVQPASAVSQVAQVIQDDTAPPMATPLRGGAAVHGISQNVYYGEYLNNHSRDIRVCRVDVASRRMESCWSFPRSEIKHVHAIHYDRFRDRLWICTGDQDHESAFYYTDDEFKSVHRFAGGDQSWRAIAVLFDKDGMEWGMDAGKDAPANAINHIYRYEFSTGQRTRLATIGNPAYAACELADGTAVMQTSFEPGRRQETAEEAALWWRAPDRRWHLCHRASYVPRPADNAGRYGAILLPTGIAAPEFLPFTPINSTTGSYRLHRISLNEMSQ